MSHIRLQIIPEAHKSFRQYAFLRWESAAVIGGTVLLWFFFPRPFSGWPRIGWPLLGAIALGAVILSSLTDVESRTRIQMELFQQSFKPSEILNPELRQHLVTTLSDLQRVELAVNRQSPGDFRESLDRIAAAVADCVAGIFRVVSRLDTFDQDPLQKRQREALPRELETMRARLQYESNATTRAQLESVLDSRLRQLEDLQGVDLRLEQSRQRLRDTVRAISALCDRVLGLKPLDVAGGQADQVERDLAEQLAQLNQLALSVSDITIRA